MQAPRHAGVPLWASLLIRGLWSAQAETAHDTAAFSRCIVVPIAAPVISAALGAPSALCESLAAAVRTMRAAQLGRHKARQGSALFTPAAVVGRVPRGVAPLGAPWIALAADTTDEV